MDSRLTGNVEKFWRVALDHTESAREDVWWVLCCSRFGYQLRASVGGVSLSHCLTDSYEPCPAVPKRERKS